MILPNDWRTEVKARQSGLTLLYSWLEDADVVAFRETGLPWLFCMDLRRFQMWMAVAGVDAGRLQSALSGIGHGMARVEIAKNMVVAAHERRSGFTTIRKWLAAEKADALLFKADRKDWLVVVDETHLRTLLVADASAECRTDASDARV